MQTDNPNYQTFVNLLYDSLQVRTSPFTGKKPLLSVAANGYAGTVLNDLQAKFDMINILTYDLSGAYPGWVPWHDSPVYNGNNINPHTGQLMPSVHDEILSCINAGVAPPKLGVGISYDAFQWKGGDGTSTGGVTAPMQVYTSDPTWTRFSYADFISNYYSGGTYHYDNSPQMAYYSKDNVGSANDEFWSFNDQPSIQDKVDYVWDHSLGGMMISELHSGYFANNSSAEKIPQLNYINDQNCLRAAPCPDPYPLCNGESYTLTATGAFTGIQWYKDGNVIPTPLGTSANLIIDEIGIYTWVGMDADGCDINNCCAIQIVEGNCCSITQTHTTPVCQNNGTGGISTDDFVNISVTPTLTGGSANVVFKIGTWTSSNIPSGQQVMLTGNGLPGNPLIPANGSDITIIIEDSLDSNCFTSFDINSSSCSQCPTLNCGTVSVQKN
ncbi:MAG: glycoside hydrolase family 18 protein [Saprospiraceae bacterium]